MIMSPLGVSVFWDTGTYYEGIMSKRVGLCKIEKADVW